MSIELQDESYLLEVTNKRFVDEVREIKSLHEDDIVKDHLDIDDNGRCCYFLLTTSLIYEITYFFDYTGRAHIRREMQSTATLEKMVNLLGGKVEWQK